MSAEIKLSTVRIKKKGNEDSINEIYVRISCGKKK